MRISLVVVAWVAAVGCKTDNPNYCAEAPEMNCQNIDAGPDGPMKCESTDDCTGTAKVCKLPDGICVECVESATCMTTTEPVCDAMSNTCVGCRAHAECALSSACLPDGSCANPAQVAYAAPNGAGTACTLLMPCGTLAEALARNLPVVKLMGTGIIDDDKVTVVDRVVTIVADSTVQLDRTNDGPILQIGGAGDVTISDLQITGAGGLGNGDAITVPDLGGNPKLTLERVVIYANSRFGLAADDGRVNVHRSVFSGNNGGGVRISADFELSNSLFVANGSATSVTGGLTLSPATTAYSFQFNTVADNVSSAGSQATTNVNCTIPMSLGNTIIKGNKVATNCAFEFSLFDPGTVVNAPNTAGNPAFRNDDSQAPTSPTYYRIGATSAAIDRANPAGVATIDIDGDPRPQAGGKDIGADEAKP